MTDQAEYGDDDLTDRRQILKSGTMAAIASGVAGWLAKPLDAIADEPQQASKNENQMQSLPYFDRIGLQLYTVRNQMAEDRQATLKAIAAAGYRQVELMSIDQDAVEIAAIARDEGMMVHSAFMDFKAITNPDADDAISVDKTIEHAERIGLRHIVFGYIGRNERDTADKCRRIADALQTPRTMPLKKREPPECECAITTTRSSSRSSTMIKRPSISLSKTSIRNRSTLNSMFSGSNWVVAIRWQ